MSDGTTYTIHYPGYVRSSSVSFRRIVWEFGKYALPMQAWELLSGGGLGACFVGGGKGGGDRDFPPASPGIRDASPPQKFKRAKGSESYSAPVSGAVNDVAAPFFESLWRV